jgi:23S rRNA (adenine1618-N6)-methyltransferase
MAEEKRFNKEDIKEGFHKRSFHKTGYDFPTLIKFHPEIEQYVIINEFETQTIDFANPAAVKELNRALLFFNYGLKFWDVPEGYLCPPVPSRADYIHQIADLLASDNRKKEIPEGAEVKGMDIGVGANCIYPVLGNRIYGWNFLASDIDEKAIQSSDQIVNRNRVLKYQIEFRHQAKRDNIFKGVLRRRDYLEFTMCNPPFHRSEEEAIAGTERKWTNLKGADRNDLGRNFGGQSNELWCEGGEVAFISKMAEESKDAGGQVLWFTSLVSKKANLEAIEKAIQRCEPRDFKIIEMLHGQKISRIVAWTFQDEKDRIGWWKRKFQKPAKV